MNSNKLLEFLGSFSLSFSATSILSLLFFGVPYFGFGSLAVSTVLTPVVYFATKKIEEKRHADDEKRLRCLKTGFTIMEECCKKNDKTIDQATTNFYYKIEEMVNKYNISLGYNDLDQINDLIYLINANYYDKIVDSGVAGYREDIIDRLITQIGLYFSFYGNNKFTRKSVLAILQNCKFINDNLKHEIFQEFISSEIGFDRWISHGIENRGIKDVEPVSPRRQLASALSLNFDTSVIDNYEQIIQGLISADDYLIQYGDISKVEWDMEVLRDFLCIILKDYKLELSSYNPTHSNFDFSRNFIYNLMCYAVFNHKKRIGGCEMIQTLKNVDFIPWDLRCNMITDVKEKMSDSLMNSFATSETKNTDHKILPFEKVKK